MGKAYDHVNCNFLIYIIEMMDFGEKGENMEEGVYKDNFSLVLVNGSRTSYLRSSRGLKQGDPLSPLLI